MDKPYFTPEDLSVRWSLPLTTLSQWRWHGKGPQYVKMGKRVRYMIEDVESFEKQFVRSKTCYEKNNVYSNIKIFK